MHDNPNGTTVNDRLDRSINGSPRLNPDEQRRFLGTFRERVSLGIKIKDLNQPHSYQGFKKDLKSHPRYLLIINGNLPGRLTNQYVTYANQHHVQFTIKTDSFYRTVPDAYGLIFASHHTAINQFPINVNQKYPVQNSNHSKKDSEVGKLTNHFSLWTKIKKLF